MTTPLAAYMEPRGIKDDEMAVLLGKDRSLVNRIRRGDVRPTLEVAAQIEKITDGAVPMQAWIPTSGCDACGEAACGHSDPEIAGVASPIHPSSDHGVRNSAVTGGSATGQIGDVSGQEQAA